MSMSISSFSSLTNRKGIGGLASGLDTDSLVEQMTAGTRAKITNQLQQRQIAMWKQEDYRSISTKMTAFKSKYFNYSSSSNNIMSPSFFKVAKPTTTSPYVKVTGDANAAKNMKIEDIKKLASASSFTSSHAVTTQKMESGKIHSTWQENTVAGKGIDIEYGGKKYTLSVSSNFYINSYDVNKTAHVKAAVDELNKSIASNAELKGKLEFKFDNATQKVSLERIGAADTKPADLRIKDGNINLMTALGLYSTKKPDGTMDDPQTKIVGKDPIRPDALFENNRINNGILAFQINGKTHNVEIGEFRFSTAALAKDSTGEYTADAVAKQMDEIKTALQKAIDKTKYNTGTIGADGKPVKGDLKDILKMVPDSTEPDGLGFSFQAVNPDGGTATLKIVGATSQELLNGLGFEVPGENWTETDTIVSKKYDPGKLQEVEPLKLADVLAGSGTKDATINFSLNNITKTISFPKADKNQFSTPAKLAEYMQKQLDKAYGKDNVFVELTSTGKLSFSTTSTDASGNQIGNPSSVFIIQNASESGVMGENAALHMMVGESNRAELSKTLGKMGGDFATALTPNASGKYELTVNGVDFTFTKDDMLGDVISKINNSAAGVTISYSSITDTFSMVSKETGAHTGVDISDKSGNLAAALFGKKGNEGDSPDDYDYIVKKGTDLELSMSFDGGNTYVDVKRSSNNFTIDGVNFEITGMADGAEQEKISFTADSNIDELYEKLETFINDYNEIVELISKKTTEKRYGIENPDDDSTKYLPLTDEQKKEMSEDDIKNWNEKARMGLLRNDQTLYGISTDMRRAMSDVTGDGDALFKIGISTAQYAWLEEGKLSIDEEKLRQILTEDPQRVSRMFTQSETGIAAKMSTALEAAVGTMGDGGILFQIAGKENSIAPDDSSMARKINDMTDKLTELKKKLQSEEDRYWAQFTRLEKYISQMNSQSSWLTSQTS